MGVGKRGGRRGVSGQLWENKGSVSSPLGLGLHSSAAGWRGVGWGGVEEHGDDGEVGGGRQRLRFEGCPGWSCTPDVMPRSPVGGKELVIRPRRNGPLLPGLHQWIKVTQSTAS